MRMKWMWGLSFLAKHTGLLLLLLLLLYESWAFVCRKSLPTQDSTDKYSYEVKHGILDYTKACVWKEPVKKNKKHDQVGEVQMRSESQATLKHKNQKERKKGFSIYLHCHIEITNPSILLNAQNSWGLLFFLEAKNVSKKNGTEMILVDQITTNLTVISCP